MTRETFTEKTCPICNKKMVRLSFDGYVYRIDRKYYCGWTCFRKAQEKIKKEKMAMTVKDLAKKSNCKLWKVYHLRKKLGRLPTVEELKNYNGKRGRPTIYYQKEGD